MNSTGCCDIFGEKARRTLGRDDEKLTMLLATEMNQLTAQEREAVYDDVHGVTSDAVQETPAFIAERVNQLRQALDVLPKSKRKAYDRALFLRPSLATDDKFQLIFLRAHQYDARLSAKKLCSHLELKQKMFGTTAVARSITVADLSSDDLECMNTGSFFFLPDTDRSGRKILFANGLLHKFKTWENLFRCFFYVIMSELEDNEEFQKKGYVIIGALMSMGGSKTWKLGSTSYILNVFPLVPDIPARPSAFHWITDSPVLKKMCSFTQMVGSKEYRLRTRNHFNSMIESQYVLQSFGIQIDESLFDEVKCGTIIQDYLNQQRRKETILLSDAISVNEPGCLVLCPRPDDILLGRGRWCQHYVGNNRLHKVILPQFVERYQFSESRMDKTLVALEVCAELKASGCRLLKKTPGGWEIAEATAAREKISQSLRNMVRGGIHMVSSSSSTTTRALNDDHSETSSRKRIRGGLQEWWWSEQKS